MEVESKKSNVDDQAGPTEKQIESLLIAFLNGLVHEQTRAPQASQPATPAQETIR